MTTTTTTALLGLLRAEADLEPPAAAWIEAMETIGHLSGALDVEALSDLYDRALRDALTQIAKRVGFEDGPEMESGADDLFAVAVAMAGRIGRQIDETAARIGSPDEDWLRDLATLSKLEANAPWNEMRQSLLAMAYQVASRFWPWFEPPVADAWKPTRTVHDITVEVNNDVEAVEVGVGLRRTADERHRWWCDLAKRAPFLGQPQRSAFVAEEV